MDMFVMPPLEIVQLRKMKQSTMCTTRNKTNCMPIYCLLFFIKQGNRLIQSNMKNCCMIEVIGRYDPYLKPLSYHECRRGGETEPVKIW